MGGIKILIFTIIRGLFIFILMDYSLNFWDLVDQFKQNKKFQLH